MPNNKNSRTDNYARRSRSKKKAAPYKYKSDKKENIFISASAIKLAQTKEYTVSANPLVSYCVVSFLTIFGNLSDILICKKCKGDISFSKSNEEGLGFHLHVKCMCSDVSLPSCPKIHKSFEINRKLVFVMRLLGVGLAGIKVFTSMMEFGSNFGETAYYNAVQKISKATEAVFLSVIKKAGAEEKLMNKENGNPENELSVSGDGTWAKRGFSSLLGVITLIGKYSGKVLDVVTKSSLCGICLNQQKNLNKVDFEIWYESEHKETCNRNHEGSAGKMEVDGVIEMFLRSLSLHAAKYVNYIGDGDSKTFKNLLDANVYINTIVNKLECVLHVGKRMFRRLTDAKKNIVIEEKFLKNAEKVKFQKEKKENEIKMKEQENLKKNVSNEKPVPKKRGRKPKSAVLNIEKEFVVAPIQEKVKTTKLTGKVMREMSTYFSLAIQRNPNSTANMKKEILAGYYHKISTDANPQHEFCDIKWCTYLQSKEKNLEYKHKPALELLAQKNVKEIYDDLTDEKLLKRCLGKNTQNNNESFNKTIWQFAPKHIYHGKEVIELSAWLAAIIYNEGLSPILKIYEGIGVAVGNYAANFVIARDRVRIHGAEHRSTELAKKRKSDQQKEKNQEQVEYEQAEGLLYAPGIADDW